MWWLIPLAIAADWPSVDQPLKTGARTPDDAAVVIGLEDYFVLPDVPYAARDAAAFYRFLVYTRGVPAENVQLLDKGGSREAVLAAVDVAAAQARDTVWIYFAGHGAASPTTGERLLLGDDVRPDIASFEARSVKVSEVRARAMAGGRRVALVLDTCYTGTDRGGQALVSGTRFAVPTYAGTPAANVAEWTAAGPGQFSSPLDEAQHGAFTYFVLGALRGWADGELTGERDGVVTAEEAQLYVAEALRALQMRTQTPELALSAPDQWIWSTAATEQGPVLDASSPSGSPAPQAPPHDETAGRPPVSEVPTPSVGEQTAETDALVGAVAGPSMLTGEGVDPFTAREHFGGGFGRDMPNRVGPCSKDGPRYQAAKHSGMFRIEQPADEPLQWSCSLGHGQWLWVRVFRGGDEQWTAFRTFHEAHTATVAPLSEDADLELLTTRERGYPGELRTYLRAGTNVYQFGCMDVQTGFLPVDSSCASTLLAFVEQAARVQ